MQLNLDFIMKKFLSYSVFIVVALTATTAQAQLFKTNLAVTVRDEVGNIVEGATLQLYETEDDYKAEKNMVAETVSDDKGVARFRDIKPLAYFVLVRKDDKNNFGGGEQTAQLEEGKFNRVTIVIQ